MNKKTIKKQNNHQLALTKEGLIQSWKLITVASYRFIILLLCVWTSVHVSMLICEQLTVSQSM